MELNQLKENARAKLKGFCRVCPVCNGKACAGEVPGMGGIGTAAGFRANLEALAQYSLNLRTLHKALDPQTSSQLFNQKIKTPILAAPMTGTTYNMGGSLSEQEFINTIISGSQQAGSIGLSGDGADPSMYDSGIEAITAKNGWGIPIIKPRSQKEIIARIKRAERAGAIAVGVDIDGAGLVTMALKGQPVGPKTFTELKELVNATKLPFIVKGIMTVDEAQMAAEAGAAAIVVSNHGGRILDYTPGAAEVLPAIAEAVGNKITILADGGVRTGIDVLKLLALGANAILLGRPLVVGTYGGGIKGVKIILDKMTSELKQAMLLTGCSSLNEITKSVIYHSNI